MGSTTTIHKVISCYIFLMHQTAVLFVSKVSLAMPMSINFSLEMICRHMLLP